jgi:hypothetical protein
MRAPNLLEALRLGYAKKIPKIPLRRSATLLQLRDMPSDKRLKR